MTPDEWKGLKARLVGLPPLVVDEGTTPPELAWTRSALVAARCGEQSAAEAIGELRARAATVDDLSLRIEAELQLDDGTGCRIRWRSFCRVLAIALGGKP